MLYWERNQKDPMAPTHRCDTTPNHRDCWGKKRQQNRRKQGAEDARTTCGHMRKGMYWMKSCKAERKAITTENWHLPFCLMCKKRRNTTRRGSLVTLAFLLHWWFGGRNHLQSCMNSTSVKWEMGTKWHHFVADNARPFDYLITTTITFVHQPAPALVQCFSCWSYCLFCPEEVRST